MAAAAEPKLRPGFTLRWELLTTLELMDISLKGGLSPEAATLETGE